MVRGVVLGWAGCYFQFGLWFVQLDCFYGVLFYVSEWRIV